MAERFSATVERWVGQTKLDLHSVFQLALQYLLEEIENKTPVRTGFLRASLKASKQGFSPLVDGRGVIGQTYVVEDYVVTIASSDPGDTIYVNFTANYAKHVEDGSRGRPPKKMVALSVQQWQALVDRAVAVVRSR